MMSLCKNVQKDGRRERASRGEYPQPLSYKYRFYRYLQSHAMKSSFSLIHSMSIVGVFAPVCLLTRLALRDPLCPLSFEATGPRKPQIVSRQCG